MLKKGLGGSDVPLVLDERLREVVRALHPAYIVEKHLTCPNLQLTWVESSS